MNNTPHSPDPNDRFNRGPMRDTFSSVSERLGIDVGGLWADPRSELRIRSRLFETVDGYTAQLPVHVEPIGFNVPVADGVTADAVWTFQGEVVIDEIDQEGLFGHEPHLVRRVLELWAWGHQLDGFRGIRVVDPDPCRTWSVADIEPAASRRSHPELISGPLPEWTQP